MSKAACQKWQETNARGGENSLENFQFKSTRPIFQWNSIQADFSLLESFFSKLLIPSEGGIYSVLNRKPYYSTPIAHMKKRVSKASWPTRRSVFAAAASPRISFANDD
ncbi:ATP synthase subunit b [Trichinella spiralis]|uniref:ATP synthase subunit b n=1 Tax=Trichinella spiralis TaxID=6334 RepID=A0ABR3K837_TRISP